jgi:Sulfotransferase family
LLRLMITSHPRIAVPPECGFAVWHARKYEDWRAGDPRLDEFLTDLRISRKIETWKLNYDRLRERLVEEKCASYAAVISAVYEQFAAQFQPSAIRWGDKNNFHVKHIVDLDRLFPKALFIHIVRDGRDVCCSYRELRNPSSNSPYAPQLPIDPVAIAKEWTSNLAAVRAGFSLIAPNRVHELRYEDLVTGPEPELQKICRFVGEDFSEAMLTYAEQNRHRELEPADFLAWKKLTLEPPTAQRVGRFHRDLDSRDIKAFNSEAEPFLRHYHYLP